LLRRHPGIDRWYEEVGKEILEQRADDKQVQRYAQAAGSALQRFQQTIREKFAGGAKAFASRFKVGSEGAGHTDTNLEVVGTETGTRVDPYAGSKPVNGSSVTSKKPQQRPSNRRGEKQEDIPAVVIRDDRGRRRILVKDSSLGLSIECAAIETGYVPFRMDWDRGCLTVNIMHEHFWSLESKEEWLVQYQLHLLSGLMGHYDALVAKDPEKLSYVDKDWFDVLEEGLVAGLPYKVSLIKVG
jgi:hypothetical protein